MDAAKLRKARDEILAVHVNAENRGDVDAVIATLTSIAVFEFDCADLMCARVY